MALPVSSSSPSRHHVRASVAVVVLACLLSLSSVAQTTTGRILGTITDQTGATVSGALVTVTDTQRGTVRTFTTESSGAYAAANLQPGVYEVRVEAKGFRSVKRENVQLEVASDALIDVALQPGNIVDVVTVTEEVPLINITSSTLGGTLSNAQINDLPLNGRNYENLLQLRPGVVRYPGGGFSTTSTNGLRAEDNAYFIEGLFNSEPYSGQAIINGAGIAGDSATILPIDSIQEFNIQQLPPAEYGWKPGSVVNVGLKSGTNSIHGTAFAFGRDGDIFDARNYFNTVPNGKLQRTLEQYGGSIGGPIVKNKAFFFGAYEGQLYNVGNSFGGITSPSMVGLPDAGNCAFSGTGDCSGSIPDAIADLQAGGIAISPASLQIAGCALAGSVVSCNGKGFPINNTQSITIPNGFNNDVGVKNTVAKVDFKLNDRQNISAMYFFGNNTGTVEDFPELQTHWLSHIHTRAQVFGGSWVWIPSSHWINEARAGYSRLYQPTLPGDLNTPASAYGLNTGVGGPFTGGLPRIGFGGFFFPGLGGFKWPKFQGPDSVTQFADHVSYTAGKNVIKFGGQFHDNRVTNASYGNSRGSITFLGGQASGSSTELEDFLAGLPFKATLEVGDPTLHLHNWAYGMFLQDDWRAARNLTLNLGVRYEFSSVPTEKHNLLGNFDPARGLVQVNTGTNRISSLYKPDHKNFSPHVGFAWDTTGSGKTVLRGGMGLTYETLNWQSYVAFNNAFGPGSVPTGAVIDSSGNTAGGNITTGNISLPFFLNPTLVSWDQPGPLYGSPTIDCSGNPCPIMTVDRNLKTPKVWNWTLSLQHAFTPNLTLEVAYVGNHGSDLVGIRDINQPPVGAGWDVGTALVPGSLTLCLQSAPAYDNCAPDANGTEESGRTFATQFPYLSNIFQMGNVYRSNYNGLQATLNSRNFHGLSSIVGYTYSHALDDVGANWDFGYGAGLPQDAHNVAAEYANSDFDVRHRLTVSLTYAVPGKKGYGQALEGWEINSIVTLQSPQHWGPIDLGTDAAGVGPLPVSPPANSPLRWNFYGNPQDFKSSPSGIPQFSGASNGACAAKALALDGGSPGAATAALNLFGCYAKGNSLMLPPALGTFGTMHRNLFPDSGFRNFDLSVAKNFHLGERFKAQFRAEFFNILNHPNFANPYGGQNGFGLNDPSAGGFGCGCATPDIAAANPAVGSGGPRSVQLGLKLTF